MLKATKGTAFATPADLESWLSLHHATAQELWVRVFKKDSGRPSVNWADCVVACIAWGWIDGQRQSLDSQSFLQRLTPRRAKSNWSKKNTEHAERLIAEGRMQPSGLAHVEAARRDGRWGRAYSGSAGMVLPSDFLKVLGKKPKAKAFFDSLSRQNQFAFYLRVATAKSADTRKKRINDLVARLECGEAFH